MHANLGGGGQDNLLRGNIDIAVLVCKDILFLGCNLFMYLIQVNAVLFTAIFICYRLVGSAPLNSHRIDSTLLTALSYTPLRSKTGSTG